MWSIADLADAASSSLQAEAARRDIEQAVRGIDALDELAVHPLLAAGFRQAGFDVDRERRYPSGRSARRESEGDRCDLVLAPRGLTIAATESRATLFEPQAAAPDEALFWMEVKIASQYSEHGPNGSWASDLVSRPRRDLRKLAAEPNVHHRGMLLLLFASHEAVIDHDLAVAIDRFAESGAPIGFPSIRSFPIRDRIGHAVAAVALLPIGAATADVVSDLSGHQESP